VLFFQWVAGFWPELGCAPSPNACRCGLWAGGGWAATWRWAGEWWLRGFKSYIGVGGLARNACRRRGAFGMMGAPCRGLGSGMALCYLIARHSAEEIAMALSATRSVPVPEDMGSFVDDLVARGDYADAADVIRAGLQALRDREDTVEQWLRDEVASTFMP